MHGGRNNGQHRQPTVVVICFSFSLPQFWLRSEDFCYSSPYLSIKNHRRTNTQTDNMEADANNGLNCNKCSEPLYFNNESLSTEIHERTEIRRWLCCGKGFHAACLKKTTPAFRCPLCKAHTAPFQKTNKIVKSLKMWVKKKKSWAVTELAMMTILGDGISKNEAKGIRMLEMAIASGDANAMTHLGCMYYNKMCDGQTLRPEKYQQMVELLSGAAS